MKNDRRLIRVLILLIPVVVVLVTCVGALLLWMAPGAVSSQVQTTYTHESSTPPNILLLIADDVGVDKINTYAGDADPDYRKDADFLPQTPTIDSLAASGLRFTDAWANPKCSPTRAAVYSGRYGFRTGIGTALGPPGQDDLDPDMVTTVAEMLAEEGYTSSMVGKWHLGEGEVPSDWSDGESWVDHLDSPAAISLTPREHGWDNFAGTLTGELDTDGSGSYNNWLRVTTLGSEVVANEETTYATEQAVNDGLAWVARQDGPWMLTMAFHAPHSPLEAPDSDCMISEDSELSSDLAVYRAMLECLDLNIADMLAGLEELGDLDDTLIFFIGDNGTDAAVAEDSFDDDRGKGTLYESGVRVPLIVADGRTWMSQQDDFIPGPDWFRSPA
ncbi:MAG: arylsulfatase B, partial [Myxococcota bacterium]